MERWNDMQRKYEETSALLSRQMQVNEELNQNILRIKELNSQLEYGWGQKFESTVRDKDLLI